MFKNGIFKASLYFPTTLKTNSDFNTNTTNSRRQEKFTLNTFKKYKFRATKRKIQNLWLKTKIRTSSY
jgi:hypothetical protein